ncbi:MAG: hypothetical protein DIJKHBIC_03419 [Thermoanaerobaculia bacterium]|nr:hypothetical protein [Thermoanaerobaculia bacterium]
MKLLLIFGVLAAVEFDGETSLGAVEIEEERTHGVLAAKLPALESPITKAPPELSLRFRHLLAKFPGAVARVQGFSHPEKCCRTAG